MKRNVVLTYASGYPLSIVEPFLSSWAEHVGSAELVIFTSGNDAAFEAAARDLGVVLLDPPSLRDYPLVIARNFAFRAFLDEHRRNYDAVLLSDARDVVFQGDPFAPGRTAPVTLVIEDETNEACAMNRLCMQKAYGYDIRMMVADEAISCAGTTIGTCEGITRYLDLMCAESDRRVTTHGEQCYHNYIAYVVRPDFIEIDREDRIVQTIGHTRRERLRFDDGRVLVDGRFAPVIHQYDRHADLIGPIRDHHRLERARARRTPVAA